MNPVLPLPGVLLLIDSSARWTHICAQLAARQPSTLGAVLH